MMWLTLPLIELRRQLRLSKTYLPDLIANQLLYLLIFFLLSGLGNIITGGEFDGQAQLSFLIGYLIWRISTGSMEEMVQSLANDARWGTLEQVWSSGASIASLLFARTINYTLFFTLRAFILFIIILPFLNASLTFRPIALFIYIITLIGTIGLAYALMGLQLIYKNVEFLTNFVAFLLFFFSGTLTSLNTTPSLYWISRLIPLSSGIDILRSLIISNLSLPELLSSTDFTHLLINSAVYLVAGLIILNWARRKTMQTGSLAHY